MINASIIVAIISKIIYKVYLIGCVSNGIMNFFRESMLLNANSEEDDIILVISKSSSYLLCIASIIWSY